ncbi:MAG: hypothetical protein K2Q20_07870 [Phycisphaerales bacterium]|nr:hypothetical protein [Phycisphaerales bacterium]
MNAHELIEMANLDAMGLLDPEEREAFERAFRAAPPALQAQIRREQLRLSTMDDLLPQAELPVGLKARVMAAVREAMQQVAGRRVASSGDVAGVIGQLRPPTGVNRLWRTAAIASVAAALAMGFVSLQFRSSIDEMRQVARNSEVSQYLQSEFGRQFAPRFFSPNTRFVKFTQAAAIPAADATAGVVAGRPSKATLLLDPSSGTGQLFCLDLPSGEREFEVVVIDREGNEGRAVLTFKSTNAGMVSSTIQGLSLENAKSVVIRLAGDTRPLLSSVEL